MGWGVEMRKKITYIQKIYVPENIKGSFVAMHTRDFKFKETGKIFSMQGIV